MQPQTPEFESSTMNTRELDIRVSRKGDLTIVAPRGEIDAASLEAFRRTVEPLCSQPVPRLIIDCRNVRFINSTAFGLLFHFHSQCVGRGGFFALQNVSKKIASIINILGLQNVLLVNPDKDGINAAVQ